MSAGGSLFNLRKASKEQEAVLFCDEIRKLIPNIDEFIQRFIELRRISMSSDFLESVEYSDTVSFQDVYTLVLMSLEEYTAMEEQSNTMHM